MSNIPAGFREIEHTADWEIEVWAPDWAALFEQAACGMYALTSTRLKPGPRLSYELFLEAFDRESLLVKFLSELLYLSSMQALGFDTFNLNVTENTLQAQLQGAALESQSKEIKAVTYHNLAVRQTQRGLEVNIVFDV
jgi:SHS2 domain-containing protein